MTWDYLGCFEIVIRFPDKNDSSSSIQEWKGAVPELRLAWLLGWLHGPASYHLIRETAGPSPSIYLSFSQHEAISDLDLFFLLLQSIASLCRSKPHARTNAATRKDFLSLGRNEKIAQFHSSNHRLTHLVWKTEHYYGHA